MAGEIREARSAGARVARMPAAQSSTTPDGHQRPAQLGALDAGHEPDVERVGEADAEHEAEGGDHPVLEQEVAEDVAPPRAQGAAGADLPRPLRDRERGEARRCPSEVTSTRSTTTPVISVDGDALAAEELAP